MCKIITVANQKGGTGKTTTVVNLSSALASEGKRVLMVDSDPQSNLTTAFGMERPGGRILTLDELIKQGMDGTKLPHCREYILKKQIGRSDNSVDDLNNATLDLIPATLELAATELNLRNELDGIYTLTSLLEPLRAFYDFIVIDTNPSLGMLTYNALVACDSVIIPVSPQLWSATGLTSLLSIILKIKKKINPSIQVDGILITMMAERTILYREAMGLIDEYFAGKVGVFTAHIPMATNVGRANFYSQSVMDFAVKSKAALAYQALAKEVLKYETDDRNESTAKA